jgi:trk system potassium uptake protein
MHVVIVGCGRIGSALAYQLYQKGHQVTVVEQDAAAFDNLPSDFQGRTVEGDILAQNVLHRAQIQNADALAAVTHSDTLNALVAHIAKNEYKVARVIAGNADPRQRALQEAFGIPVIGSSSWGAQRFLEMIASSPLRAIMLDGSSEFPMYQLQVPETWVDRTLQDLLPGDQITIIALIRDGSPLPTASDQSLIAGDLIYLSAEPKEIEALEKKLGFYQE